MSGGFYGVSKTLAKDMVSYPDFKRFMNGIEDMQIGKLIHAVALKENGNIKVVNWPNGQKWCHFKSRDDITPAILSGNVSFDGFDCMKR